MKQTTLPITNGSLAPARIRTRLKRADNLHAEIEVWLNGDLITNGAGLTLRNRDFIYLMDRLQPEIIIVKRDLISDDLWKRIKHLREVELI